MLFDFLAINVRLRDKWEACWYVMEGQPVRYASMDCGPNVSKTGWIKMAWGILGPRGNLEITPEKS